MKLGFSTLGDPGLTLEGARALRRREGLDFIELRALENRLDLPRYFRSREPTDDTGQGDIRVLASSLQLRNAVVAELAEFRHFVELAIRLNVRYIRVFGGGAWGEVLDERTFDRAAKNIAEVRRITADAGWTGEVVVETHGAFATSLACEALNARLKRPVAILWDSHHTWRLGGETVGETWSRIGRWVRHIHFKDSLDDKTLQTGFRYVLPGAGDFPSVTLLRVLQRAAYSGGISLEWEMLWHSDLPPLSLALTHFRAVCAAASKDDAG